VNLTEEGDMYIYTVQPMRGQRARFEGDTSVKYQVRRVNTDIPSNKKGRNEVIRTNLEFDKAAELIKGFNNMEAKSQVIRDEARQRNM
jgi:hypothetical protein